MAYGRVTGNLFSTLFAVLLFSAAPAHVVASLSSHHDCPANPYADPRNDPCNYARYIASNVLTSIALVLCICVATLQTIFIFKVGAKWMLTMTIGVYCFCVGIAARYGMHAKPDSKGIYIFSFLFTVLSPCAFIAAEYVLLGRLSRHLQAEAHLLIRPSRITLLFVMSDVTTFFIQAIGGSILVSTNKLSTESTAKDIFLAGLGLQLGSFVCFIVVFFRFLYRVHKYLPQSWARDSARKWHSDWRMLAVALGASSACIVVRCVYRLVEESQGFHGHLATSEGFFYGLDTLPLFLAVAVYVPFWPGRFIRGPATLPKWETPVGSTVEEDQTSGIPLQHMVK